MKILLLGAAGQVGFELHRSLAPLGQVVAATRDGRLPGGAAGQVADLSRPDTLHALLRAVDPALVVNAAAYTAVDRAETEPDLAACINATAPGVLAAWCAEFGRRLVHYSTDYVFDGRDIGRPWREDDPTDPLCVYGRSKRDGEQAIVAAGGAHLILRTAWVHAARGHNFLRTMLRLGAEREQLRIVADQFGAPTPARWIAATTAALLAGWRNDDRWPQGVLHLTAGGSTSWFGFAEAVLSDALAAGLIARLPDMVPIASAEYPMPARRPAWSCLDTRALAQVHGLALPDWREGVAQTIAELAS